MCPSTCLFDGIEMAPVAAKESEVKDTLLRPARVKKKLASNPAKI